MDKGPSRAVDPDDFDAYVWQQCQDPNFSFHYGRSSAWADFQRLPWWRRVFVRFAYLPAVMWPGTEPGEW